MTIRTITIPTIALSERTPIVDQLLDIIGELQKQLVETKEEIARLKKHKGKPKISPSRLGQSTKKNRDSNKKPNNPQAEKQDTPDRVEIIKVENLPKGSRFKGYRHYKTQELIIKRESILYKLERWQLADDSYITASLPVGVAGKHFGPTLQTYALHQHHHQGVTQPLLLSQLRELRFSISSGQLNNLLIEKKEPFHREKTALLPAALSVSRYVHVDDTGARHDGKNGYCTHIGNELFAWFESTSSKSRLNFLTLLRHEHKDYVLNEHSFDYMERQRLAPFVIKKIAEMTQRYFADKDSWNVYLTQAGITRNRHIKIATEAALIGSVLKHGFSLDTVIMSDDAGQFNIFNHVLCWFHIERNIHKLIPSQGKALEAVEKVRGEIWDLYQRLKKYKEQPSLQEKKTIQKEFNKLCKQKTCYQLLNNQLNKMKASKAELLLVLERPELPLHNNLSERDIREYVKRRKISGSTRSDAGRQCRDTFTSLKKTALKLKVPFWDYLMDRITQKGDIQWLPDLVLKTAHSASAPG